MGLHALGEQVLAVHAADLRRAALVADLGDLLLLGEEAVQGEDVADLGIAGISAAQSS